MTPDSRRFQHRRGLRKIRKLQEALTAAEVQIAALESDLAECEEARVKEAAHGLR